MVSNEDDTAEPADRRRRPHPGPLLAVGQIYLMTNPLLTEPLRLEHIKPRRSTTGAPVPA
jgi:hypothetical protein